MAQVLLTQRGEFRLAGVTLLPGLNDLDEKTLDGLKEQWGFNHAIEHGLIKLLEPKKPEKTSTSEKPEKKQKA